MQIFYKILLLILLSCFIILTVYGEEVKYPPYPDVWGYDLSKYVDEKDRDKKIYIFSAYLMDDGDIWFKFRLETEYETETNAPLEWFVLKYFKGEIKKIEKGGEDEKLIALKRSSIDESDKVSFSDGSAIISTGDGFAGKLCNYDSIRQQWLAKYDPEGNEIGTYSAIIAYPKVTEIIDNSSGSCEYPANVHLIYKQLRFFPTSFAKLYDDTFLMYDGGGGPLIARIDKNLNTKFKSEVNYKTRDGCYLKRNLFIIPYSIVDEFISEALHEKSESIEQSLHDKLINYFILQQGKNNK